MYVGEGIILLWTFLLLYISHTRPTKFLEHNYLVGASVGSYNNFSFFIYYMYESNIIIMFFYNSELSGTKKTAATFSDVHLQPSNQVDLSIFNLASPIFSKVKYSLVGTQCKLLWDLIVLFQSSRSANF